MRDGEPRPRAGDRAELILRGAEQLFFEHGYQNVSVDEIGKAAGVSGPALYRHFKGKSAILEVLLEEVLTHLLMTTTGHRHDPWSDLRELSRDLFRYSMDNRRLIALYARERRHLAPRERRRHTRREDRYMARWDEVLERHYPRSSRFQRLTAARAAHSILMTEALYGPDEKRARELEGLVVDMAMRSVAALHGYADDER